MNADLDDARHNLVANFRTITLIAASSADTADSADSTEGGGTLPPLDVVGRWLREFNAAYLEANHHVHQGRLHALHGRRLVLVGDHLLPDFGAAGQLCEIALECGIGVALAVSIDGMARYPLAFATLRSAHPSLQLQIDCSALDAKLEPERLATCADVLRTHAESGGELNLVGDIAALRASGLLDCVEFNRMGFSVSPFSGATRLMHRPHRIAPCRDFVSLHIDPAGRIYPCAGMIGHAASCLGSVNAPFADMLDTLAATRRSIDALVATGPRIAAYVEQYPVDLCALHRAEVASLAAL